jgi:hypothetical protein
MTLQTTGVKAATFLMSKGMFRNAAITIPAVCWYESKLNPGPQGVQSTETPGALNPGGAYGICSWNGDRQQGLADFAKAKNLPVDQLETQLWFVLNEAANRYPKTWAALTNPQFTYEHMIPVFVADYENPKDHQREIEGSLAFARELAPLVPNIQPTPETPTPPVLAPSPIPPPVTPPWSFSGPHIDDSEIETMAALYSILKPLDQAARHRVLVYIYGRFVTE